MPNDVEPDDSMLPAFDDYGNLPAGIHFCTVEELAARFGGGSEERAAQMSELLHFIAIAKSAGVLRLMVNGSFVTGKLVPNDVDVVFLPGPDYPRRQPPLDRDDFVLPFLQIIVAADEQDFESWANTQFSTDRKRRPKGVVEIIL